MRLSTSSIINKVILILPILFVCGCQSNITYYDTSYPVPKIECKEAIVIAQNSVFNWQDVCLIESTDNANIHVNEVDTSKNGVQKLNITVSEPNGTVSFISEDVVVGNGEINENTNHYFLDNHGLITNVKESVKIDEDILIKEAGFKMPFEISDKPLKRPVKETIMEEPKKQNVQNTYQPPKQPAPPVVQPTPESVQEPTQNTWQDSWTSSNQPSGYRLDATGEVFSDFSSCVNACMSMSGDCSCNPA